MQIELFVSRTWDFLREIARLNKKAARIGVAQIVAEDHGKVQKTRTVVTVDEDGNENLRTYPVEVNHFTLTTPEPADHQWDCIVKITPVDGGAAFAEAMPAGTAADAEAWKGADSQNCDHCHTRRGRLISYVVKHKTDGRVLQLGRNCFQDYIGKDTLAALEFQSVIVSSFCDDEGFWPMERGGMRQIPIVNVVECIAAAEAMFRKDGWMNNQRDPLSGEILVEGTHRIAARRVQNAADDSHLEEPTIHRNLWSKWIAENVTAGDREFAQMVIDRMQQETVEGEFGTTLQNVADYQWIPARKASLACYMGQFLRQIDRKAREAAMNATRVYVGTVGVREVFENLTCVRCSNVDTDFGVLYINAFNDANGNVLVWKTGSMDFKEGETVTLQATVKDHTDYKGTKQTILSRCKVLDAEAVAKAQAKAARAAAKALKAVAQ